MTAEWFLENRDRFTGELLFNEPLARHTYYRIGGPASVLAAPRSLEDLRWIAEGLRRTKLPCFVMGAGSNLLVSDRGFEGLVLRTHKMNLTIDLVEGHHLHPVIRTGASVAVGSLLRRAQSEGWGGLEFLCGIPGLVGGALWMNAGTRAGEVKDRVHSVTMFDLMQTDPALEFRRLEREQMAFEYRKNLFVAPNELVWSVDWQIEYDSPASIRKTLETSLARRRESQPVNFPSCGSVFKNPKSSGLSAWQVINELGLRGQRIGNAQYSVKHSNFIVNLGGATAADVMALIRVAQTRAEAELGIRLETEVRILGSID